MRAILPNNCQMGKIPRYTVDDFKSTSTKITLCLLLYLAAFLFFSIVSCILVRIKFISESYMIVCFEFVCAGNVKYFGPSHMRDQCKYVWNISLSKSQYLVVTLGLYLYFCFAGYCTSIFIFIWFYFSITILCFKWCLCFWWCVFQRR